MYNPDVNMYNSEVNRTGRRPSDRGIPASPEDEVWFSRRMRHAAKQAGGPTSPSGDGIVLVDSNLKPIAADKGAQAILDEVDGHCGGGDGGASLPRDLLNALTA